MTGNVHRTRAAFLCGYHLLPYLLPTKNAQRHSVLSWYTYSGAPPSCNSCSVFTVMRIPSVAHHNKTGYRCHLAVSFPHLIQKRRSGFVTHLLTYLRIKFCNNILQHLPPLVAPDMLTHVNSSDISKSLFTPRTDSRCCEVSITFFDSSMVMESNSNEAPFRVAVKQYGDGRLQFYDCEHF